MSVQIAPLFRGCQPRRANITIEYLNEVIQPRRGICILEGRALTPRTLHSLRPRILALTTVGA